VPGEGDAAAAGSHQRPDIWRSPAPPVLTLTAVIDNPDRALTSHPPGHHCLRRIERSNAGYFIGVAGNQTARAGRFLRELNLPCDVLATSAEWGAVKPDAGFFGKLAAVSGHDRSEIAYVGDRLDNDIAPAAHAGLFTIWVQRGPWGYVLRSDEPFVAARLPEGAPSLTVRTLAELVTELSSERSTV
jgi:FMN phosphatase YigB (HAD superfamily)